MGRVSQHPTEQVSSATESPTLTSKIHFLLGGHRDPEHGCCFFLGRSRSCPGTQCPGVGLQRFNQQGHLLLQRPWELGSPEKLKSKGHPVKAELWLLVIIFSLSLLLLNHTFLSRNLLLSFPPWVYLLYFCLIQTALSTLRASILFILTTLHSSWHKGYSP